MNEGRENSRSAKASELSDGFWSDIARDGINKFQAVFNDRQTENAYQDYLVQTGIKRERLLQLLGVVAFSLFGILDVLVTGPLRYEFLAIRFLIAVPAALAVIGLTSLPKFRRHFGLATINGLLVFAGSIVYMVYKMPNVGAPPYIIGLLVVVIFTSCLMRIRFAYAALTYTSIAAGYCLVLSVPGRFPLNDLYSGYFFIVSITIVAVVTIYLQELRTRQIWRRGVQREKDAAYITELLVEATAADQSKLNFLSILNHELRTPLHQIIGFSEIVRNEASVQPEKVSTEYLDAVVESAQGLLRKLSKMLRYADASAGKLQFVPEKQSVREILGLVQDQLTGAAETKCVHLDTSNIQKADLFVDAHHTIFALQNLVENAINASQRGARVEIRGAQGADGRYLLEILDSGRGMSDQQISQALTPFNQGESVRTRKSEGLGLGLTLAHRLLTSQGASVTIRSKEGSGTRISISFASPPDEKAENVAA